MSLHHLTYVVRKGLIARELEFWALLGFCPTGLRRVGRGEPVIHWLVGADHSHAVELLPASGAIPPGLGHTALAVPLRRWEIAVQTADRYEHPYEICEDYPDFGNHAFFHSPTGHIVELFTNRKALKSGPPLVERYR